MHSTQVITALMVSVPLLVAAKLDYRLRQPRQDTQTNALQGFSVVFGNIISGANTGKVITIDYSYVTAFAASRAQTIAPGNGCFAPTTIAALDFDHAAPDPSANIGNLVSRSSSPGSNFFAWSFNSADRYCRLDDDWGKELGTDQSNNVLHKWTFTCGLRADVLPGVGFQQGTTHTGSCEWASEDGLRYPGQATCPENCGDRCVAGDVAKLDFACTLNDNGFAPTT